MRHDTLKVAERLAAELGEEQLAASTAAPAIGPGCRSPMARSQVGIDGGYVRIWEAKKTNFEVIVGKSILAFKRDAV